MVTRAPPHWPDDVPYDAKVLADKIIAMLNEYEGNVAGPALCCAFSFLLLEFGGHDGDLGKLSEILRDVGALVTRYHAAIPRHAH
jgi:hypothetical protein